MAGSNQATGRSLWSRKKDMVYLGFFAFHILVILFNDAVALYPKSITPAFMTNQVADYAATFGDRNFINPPAWFKAYTWVELLYHTPVSIYAVGALWRDDSPTLPLHILIFAVHTVITTFTCIADMLSWEDFPVDMKTTLAGLYSTYLALATFMSVDMFGRLSATLTQAAAANKKVASKTQ